MNPLDSSASKSKSAMNPAREKLSKAVELEPQAREDGLECRGSTAVESSNCSPKLAHLAAATSSQYKYWTSESILRLDSGKMADR